jgi:hygromycin-B 7''-O-kinase
MESLDMHNSPGRRYSERLGVLSPAQFQAALDRFDLGQFVQAEPISAGNFGQNVFLTSTTGEYVLRGAPFYPSQLPKERFFTQQLHEYTRAPVPWPYRLDPSAAIFGWSYVLMPRMPGLQLSDPGVRRTLGQEDRRGIARAMGGTLAELHRLEWSCAGEYDLETDTIRPFPTTYGEWIISSIHGFVQAAVSLSDRTTEADVKWVDTLIAQNRTALDVPFQPCFVMSDYKEDNAVVECQGGTWVVSGVFDYMDAWMGDGEQTLVRSVTIYAEQDIELAREFVRAYMRAYTHAHGRARSLRPGYAERFPIYMLYDRTLIWQFGQRHGVWWDPSLTLREWASPYTSLLVF